MAQAQMPEDEILLALQKRFGSTLTLDQLKTLHDALIRTVVEMISDENSNFASVKYDENKNIISIETIGFEVDDPISKEEFDHEKKFEKEEVKENVFEDSVNLDQAKKTVAEGRLEEALDLISKFMNKNRWAESILHLKANYQFFKNDQIRGTLSYEEIKLERMNFVHRIFLLIDDYEKGSDV